MAISRRGNEKSAPESEASKGWSVVWDGEQLARRSDGLGRQCPRAC
jgi:hypothetical protein